MGQQFQSASVMDGKPGGLGFPPRRTATVVERPGHASRGQGPKTMCKFICALMQARWAFLACSVMNQAGEGGPRLTAKGAKALSQTCLRGPWRPLCTAIVCVSGTG